jgi:meso-butanediol dehydrogenase/(S,S)-butanediol dehydrogenase/diacetyl reductase
MADGEPKAREFDGKGVIVTGAASGLGRATALAFARAGARLTLADVNATGLEETAAAARSEDVEVATLVADVSDPAACAAIVAKAASIGSLDALCNVAGVLRFNTLDRITPAEFDLVLGVNLKGPLFLTQAAMPHLIRSEGAVVNVASAAAFMGHAYMLNYAASKAALVNLTKSLALEFSKTPVRINAIAPGAMETPMATQPSFPESGIDFELIARFSGLRGMGQPEDVTETILLLASPRGKAFHGTCVVADRGITAG